MTGQRRVAVLRMCLAIVFASGLNLPTLAWSADGLSPKVATVVKAADVSLSSVYDLPGRPAVLDALLRHPILFGKLWTAYGFAPAYKVQPQGAGLYVEDPTGIAGNILLVQHSANRRVYLAEGAVNHRLVPAFKGTMVVVLTTRPKGNTVHAQVDLYVRTSSRVLGFLASTFFPLLKGRIENRMMLNAQDVGVILKDVSTAPRRVAARLSGEDATALVRLFPQPRGR